MKFNLSLRPNQIKDEIRFRINSERYLPYTGAYVGAYTYCSDMHIDNGIEFEVESNRIVYNLQIGKYNSIGANLECVFGRNHNFKSISTGAVQLMFKEYNVEWESESTFNQKGSIIIQNDIWIGENVTIMPGTIIRNGAVIARNSHVVSDVPPYAIVGGNPARVIGYRYSEEQIEKLQKISWWDWSNEKIIENAKYFTDDVEKFCDRFYEEAERKFAKYIDKREVPKGKYFVVIDYYENYSNYSKILENFLDIYINNSEKQLVLFIKDDDKVDEIDAELYANLTALVAEINLDNSILCKIEVVRGTIVDAEECLLSCSHYISTRTYDTVYLSCLADKLNIEIISGVDGIVQFEKSRNMYKAPSPNC